MKHYPNEIAHKTFERKMMGYDPDDVSHFLTIVAAQMDALLQEMLYVKPLKKKICLYSNTRIATKF